MPQTGLENGGRAAQQQMFNASPLATFSLREPYPAALVRVRLTLAKHGLSAAAEVDVTARIKQELGAQVKPCTILFVDDPVLLLEGIVFHRGGALGIPQPVVVSESHLHTEIFVRKAEPLARRCLPASLDRPLEELQRRIAVALESIAEREERLVYS